VLFLKEVLNKCSYAGLCCWNKSLYKWALEVPGAEHYNKASGWRNRIERLFRTLKRRTKLSQTISALESFSSVHMDSAEAILNV